jgi:nucleotide-binding universal stress UspA family protein
MEVVVLGHFGLPEQTPPDAGRDQFEDEARAELDALAEPFEESGSLVATRVVFGKDRRKTIEEGCDAELDPAHTEGIERILVPLLDTENLDRLEDFVGSLCEERTTEITLFHVAEMGGEDGEDEDPEEVKAMLRTAREKMIADGFDADLIDVSVVVSDSHDEEILTKAEEYDAVVMSEADPGIRERIFGTLPDRVAEQTGDPVVVVRRNV